MAWELWDPCFDLVKEKRIHISECQLGLPWGVEMNHYEMKKYSFSPSNRHALNCIKLMGDGQVGLAVAQAMRKTRH